MRLVDADALKRTVEDFPNCYNGWSDTYDKAFIIGAIEEMPTIDAVEVVRGEWINMGDFEQCSVCKGTHLKEVQTYYGKATWIKTDFCPNCGAKMKGADDE